MEKQERIDWLKKIIQPWFVEAVMKDEEFPLTEKRRKIEGASYLEGLRSHKNYHICEGPGHQPLTTIIARGGYGKEEAAEEASQKRDKTQKLYGGIMEVIFGSPTLSYKEFTGLARIDQDQIKHIENRMVKDSNNGKAEHIKAERQAIRDTIEAIQAGVFYNNYLTYDEYKGCVREALTQLKEEGELNVPDEVFKEKLEQWGRFDLDKEKDEEKKEKPSNQDTDTPSHSSDSTEAPDSSKASKDRKQNINLATAAAAAFVVGGVASAIADNKQSKRDQAPQPGQATQKPTQTKEPKGISFRTVALCIVGAALTGWAAYMKWGPGSNQQSIKK